MLLLLLLLLFVLLLLIFYDDGGGDDEDHDDYDNAVGSGGDVGGVYGAGAGCHDGGRGDVDNVHR